MNVEKSTIYGIPALSDPPTTAELYLAKRLEEVATAASEFLGADDEYIISQAMPETDWPAFARWQNTGSRLRKVIGE